MDERIKEARIRAGVSQAELGKACGGISRAAVAQWETPKKNGGTAPTLDKLEAISSTLDVEGEWILTGRPAKSRKVGAGDALRVPEYDVRVSAGGGFIIQRETIKDERLFSRHYLIDELRLPAAELVVLEVIGDSMEPTLRSGDRVLVNMGDKRVSQPGVFVLWDGDGTVVKRLEIVPSTKPLRIRRSSDNPLHDTHEVLATDTMIVGRVVWYARRL